MLPKDLTHQNLKDWTNKHKKAFKRFKKDKKNRGNLSFHEKWKEDHPDDDQDGDVSDTNSTSVIKGQGIKPSSKKINKEPKFGANRALT